MVSSASASDAMQFFAFGINHETAPFPVVEAFSLTSDAQRRIYGAFSDPVPEFVLLSTCNRTEVYLYGTEADVRRIRKVVAEEVEYAWPEDEGFEHRDEEAVRHVLQVTAGVRSLVPGDAQILAQMKEAYRRADEAGSVDMVLHRLMHTAFRAAKRVAQETDLAAGAASVSTAAVAMAADHLSAAGHSMAESRVVLLGVGQMGQLALQAVQRHHPEQLIVANRSIERARRVAEKVEADLIPWSDRLQAVTEADVVFVATGADSPILEASDLSEADRLETPLLVFDISMPHNVDSAVGRLPGVTLYDLPALQSWVDRVQSSRQAEVPTAADICDELVVDFVTWVFHQEALQPAIEAIRSTFNSIREQEIERHHHRFTELDREELDQLTQSILQKLLAVPIVRLKNVDPDSIDFVRGIRLLSTLFSRPGCEDGAREVSEPGAACPVGGHAATPEEIEDHINIERLREVLSNVSTEKGE